MKVVIAGGNSYLGQVLARFYAERAQEVVLLVRRPRLPQGNIRYEVWDGQTPGLWMQALNGAALLINMAGRTVNCRYTERNKREIVESRVYTTTILGEAVRRCVVPPRVWLNAASATMYRHAEDRPMDEYTGETGQGFSVEVCRRWEETFFAQVTPGTRKVALRTTIVFGKRAPVVLTLFNLVKMGLGGKQGTGRQMLSWIHETDFARATEWLYRHDEMDGTVNLAAPNPLPNTRLMQKIRKTLAMPFGLPSPKWLLEIGAVFIRTETELVLKSRWILPARLKESGFRFLYPDMDSALAQIRGQSNSQSLPFGSM